MADIKQLSVNNIAYDIKDEVARNGLLTKQDAITRVTASVDSSVGTPSVNPTWNNGTLDLAFHNVKGEQGIQGIQGPQGLSCIVGEGDLPLDHVLGQDGTKAMSQKGVTDAINEGKISNGETTFTVTPELYHEDSTYTFAVNGSTGQYISGATAWRSTELELTPDMVSITYNANASTAGNGYAFVKDDGTYVSGSGISTAGYVTIDTITPMMQGATKFRCCKNQVNENPITLTIKKETFSWPQKYDELGENINGWITQRGIKEAMSVVVKTLLLSNFSADGAKWYINNQGNFNGTSQIEYAYTYNVTSYRGKRIKIIANSEYSAHIAFFTSFPTPSQQDAHPSEYYCDGTSITRTAVGGTFVAVIPNDCVYVYLRAGAYFPESIVISESIQERIEELPDEIAIHTSEQISEEMKVTLAEISTFPTSTWNFYINDSGKWSSTTASNYANDLDGFGIYKGKQIAVHAKADVNCRIAFLKEIPVPADAGTTVTQYCDGTTHITITKSTIYKGVIPEDCKYLYVRHMYGDTDATPTKIVIGDSVVNVVEEIASGSKPVVYVSSSGNDNNPGTSTAPKKTIASALNAGAADMTIVLMSDITGGIDLTNWNGKKNHVTIRGDKNQNRKIIVGKKLAGEGWQAYEGYDDVYSYTKGDGESLPTDSIQSQYLTYYWLWQYDIADTRSLISASERHPLQRGRQYRMRSTKVEYVATLAALLAATSPCWTLDDGKLYVRVVAGSDTSANPIYMPSDYGNAIITGNYCVTLSNIETWFGRIYVGGWAQSSEGNGDYLFEAKDCAVRCCTGSGGWQIDDGVSVHLERCEVEGVTMIGSTGDGFNLHPQSGGTRPFAKDSTHTLIDCWAHDMRDDGYSDHGRSEGTIIGGLFEYNGKGGIAPATGSHDTVYNATCRNNYYGIITGGGAAGDGGIGTQTTCFGCISIGNLYNYACLGSTVAMQDKLELHNCISRTAKSGGAGIYAKNPCEVIVRDCTDSGSPVAKKTESNGVITIDNGTVIS